VHCTHLSGKTQDLAYYQLWQTSLEILHTGLVIDKNKDFLVLTNHQFNILLQGSCSDDYPTINFVSHVSCKSEQIKHKLDVDRIQHWQFTKRNTLLGLA